MDARAEALRRKNAAFAALERADQQIARWQHRHYSRQGYAPLPAGWAERREQLAREYAEARAAVR